MKIRDEVVKSVMSDIEYLESLENDEIEWDSIDPNQYSPQPTNEEIKEAFQRCGYSVK